MILILGAILAGKAAGAPLAATPPTGLSEGFQVAHWKTSHGLPANTIKCIHQTRDGYLWVGTDFGIVRFDGQTFTIFDQVNTPEISDDTCAAFCEDAEGALWVATLDGVLRYRDGQFDHWSTQHGLPHRKAWEIGAGPDDALWIWTQTGLARLQQGRISTFGAEHGMPPGVVHQIVRMASGEMAFLVDSKPPVLLLHDPQADCLVPAPLPATLQDRLSKRVAMGGDGSYWVGHLDGVHRFRDGQWTLFTTDNGLADNDVQRLFVDRLGVVWATTGREVLHYFRDERFVPVKFSNDDFNPHIHCLTDDAEGNLWMGTEDGLFCLIPGRIQILSRREGLPEDSVRLLSVGRNDVIWMVTGSSLMSISNGQVRSFHTLHWNENNHIGTFHEDQRGRVWAAVNKEGIYRLEADHLEKVRWLPDLIFSAMTEDREGFLWIGSSDGLIRLSLQDGQLVDRTTHPALQQARILELDRAGDLWVGTYGQGLIRLHDGHVAVTYTTESGLPDNRVLSLYHDAQDAVWIGTENGLGLLRGGRLFTFLPKHGLPESVINKILEDEAGYLWLSGLRGIHRALRSDLEAVAEDRAARVHFVSFGETDGMLSSETNGERQPSGGKTSTGTLLFPTLRGIAAVNPKSIRDNERAPQVIVERVRVDDLLCYQDGCKFSPQWKLQSQSGKSELILKPGQARVLEIAYTATSFTDPAKVRFRYQLEGLDTDWHEVEGHRRRALYTNLKPGPYVFRVKACNNHGYWNETGASFAFFLAPSFYQTWPAYVLAALAVVGLAAAIQSYRLAIQRRFLRLQQQAALDQQRAQFARDMHDDIGSSLTQIAILSEVAKKALNDPGQAKQQVERISTTARSIIDNLSELVWASNPGNDALDNLGSYLREHIARYFEPTDIRCHIFMPDALPAWPVNAKLRRNLFLVFKEALNNILKHAQATRVDLTLKLENRQLLLIIADNGNGNGPAFHGLAGVHPPTGRHGLGLPGMCRRVTDLGGQFQFHSQPGHGTTVRIRLPLPSPGHSPSLTSPPTVKT